MFNLESGWGVVGKHMRVLDRNLKNLKDLKKLELFDSQFYQIFSKLELKKLESLNLTIIQT